MHSAETYPHDQAASTPSPKARVLAAALGQRQLIALLACFLILTLVDGVLAAVGAPIPARFTPMATLIEIALVLAWVVQTYLLTRAFGGVGQALTFALLSFIPPFNLFLAGVLSFQATALLRANGLRVGFFGADLRKVRAWTLTPESGPHPGHQAR